MTHNISVTMRDGELVSIWTTYRKPPTASLMVLNVTDDVT